MGHERRGTHEQARAAIECPLCARAQLPETLVVQRSIGPFDAVSVPAGLLRNHVIGEGWWGRVRVIEGEVVIALQTVPPTVKRLGPGACQPIPPRVGHSLRLCGPVLLALDLLSPPVRHPAPPIAAGWQRQT